MVKTSSSEVQQEEVPKSKKRSNSKQEKKAGVSEITEFFTPKEKMSNSAINAKKTPARACKEKDKDSEKKRKHSNKEIKEIKGINECNEASEKTNGDGQLRTESSNNEHANCNQQTEEPLSNASIESEITDQTNINWADASEMVNNSKEGDETSAQDTPIEVVAKQKAVTSTATQTSEDLLLEKLTELTKKVNKMDDDLNHPKNGVIPQLAKTTSKVSDIHDDIHAAVGGLKVRMDKAVKDINEHSSKIQQMESNNTRMASLLGETKRLIHELKIMQGLVQRVTQQATHNSAQVMDLTKRGMEQNLLLHGVDDGIEVEDPKLDIPIFKPKERCKQSALKFFKEIMKLEIETEDVWKAHRIGALKPGKVRPLVVKVSYAAKDLIMENLTSLKGRKNAKTQQTYFINEQIPEGVTETKKQISARVKNLQDLNANKPPGAKDRIQVVNDKILVNGHIEQPEIEPPQPEELFLDIDQQKEVDKLQTKMVETEPFVVRNSRFTAIAMKVHSLEEIKQAYIAVSQRYPSSDHIMLGYAFKDKRGKLKSGACDDKEFGAGAKIKKKIFDCKAKNTAVFVLRKYGGIHLGFDRFRAIETVSEDALKLLEEL